MYLGYLSGYFRYGLGLRQFLKQPLSISGCYAVVRAQMEKREANFRAQLRRAVYPNPRSPYRKLLEHARCELRDIESMLRREGLEQTLRKLSEAGVYITAEEYKGKKPVDRNRLSFKVQPEDFDNPYVVTSFEQSSSGTRSQGIRTQVDFDFLSDEAAVEGVAYDELGLYGVPYAIWNNNLRRMLRTAKIGAPPEKLYFRLSSNKIRLVSYWAIIASRLHGSPLPWPEKIRPQEARRVAEWLAKRKSQGSRRVGLWASASSLVRVAMAARESDLDISGSYFVAGGEPLTAARQREIEAAGCAVSNFYGCAETAVVARGCTNSTGDEMHLFKNKLAVIEQSRAVGSTGTTVNAFRFTSLTPAAPKILINLETGDYGKLETKHCGCKFDTLGFTDHLSYIRSFEKLTSEGRAFFAGDLARVIEEVLPAQFGGSPLDYQAVEEEGERGLSRLAILVSPKVGDVHEGAVLQTVLGELKKDGGTNRRTVRIWEEAGTLQVRREEPKPTKGGKVYPFQVHVG